MVKPTAVNTSPVADCCVGLPIKFFKHLSIQVMLYFVDFLQRCRIACNAERCNTYSNSVYLSVCLSVWHTLVP